MADRDSSSADPEKKPAESSPSRPVPPGAACPFPGPPPPVRIRLTHMGEQPCPYLPGKVAWSRAFWVERVPPSIYQGFMDANFRRSGKILYQPVCRHCRECRQIRVPVATFQPSKSQRRTWRRNADLLVSHGPPRLTDETFDLYRRYVAEWHRRDEPEAPDGLRDFLYESPVDTVEYLYREPGGRLVGVGICDLCPSALSSVYFFHEPAEARRGLGTFAALYELAECQRLGLQHYYLGYWIAGAATMHYKANFRPCEVLHADNVWRAPAQGPPDGAEVSGLKN